MKFNIKNKIAFAAPFFLAAAMMIVLAQCKPAAEASETEEETLAWKVSDMVANNPAIQIGAITSQNVQPTINCTGLLELPPTELVFVHSKTEGFVKSLNYLPGDYVRSGSVLATIENPKLIEKQRILLETKADLAFAENEFLRKQALKDGQATTERSYQEALAVKSRLSATYEGLKSELSLMGIQVERLEQERNFQSVVSIIAGEGGYVHSIDVNMGQMIQPHDKLMEVANNAHIHLELNVLAKDFPMVKKGQKVRFRLPNDQQDHLAEIIKINPLIDPETGTMNAHCHLDKPKAPGVKPGVFANAKIYGESREMTTLSMAGVVKEGDDYYGFRVVQDVIVKEKLSGTEVHGDWISFANDPSGTWVLKGAYYLE